MKKLSLSILIVVYNMRREAPRTILSALPPYQKNVSLEDYEIIILDNGSTDPVSDRFIDSLPYNVTVVSVPKPTPSPGNALNWGVKQIAKSENLLISIDGARIFSDRLVEQGIKYRKLLPNSFIYTLGWHIGPEVHMRARETGYNQLIEDQLLEEADWRNHPDELFRISVLAGSSRQGLLGKISESNAFFITRTMFDRIGGYDNRFKLPGGSLCNLEFFSRCTAYPNSFNVLLASESTFHQYHGGAATSGIYTWKSMADEYKAIIGRPYEIPDYETLQAGRPRDSALEELKKSFGALV